MMFTTASLYFEATYDCPAVVSRVTRCIGLLAFFKIFVLAKRQPDLISPDHPLLLCHFGTV
jgi:hypothetical protein